MINFNDTRPINHAATKTADDRTLWLFGCEKEKVYKRGWQDMTRLMFSFLLLVPLTACASSSVPLRSAYSDYGEYLSTSTHYKAFATTRARRSGQAWGWAFGERTPQEAIDAALGGCDQGRGSETTSGRCILHSIGNRDVSGLTGAELEEAIRQYKANPN